MTVGVPDPSQHVVWTDMKAVIDEASRAVTPIGVADPSELATVTLGPGDRVETLEFERFLDHPRRKTGTVDLIDDDSFARYVNKHKVAGETELYADVEARRIVGVLNGHAGNGDGPDAASWAGWADHRAVLALRHSPNWQHWVGKNNRPLGQVAFAEHIEDGIDDIVSPPGAEMLELAQTFEAKNSVEFKSSQILASGQRKLLYQETIAARAGSGGDITVPSEFELGLCPFEGSPIYRVNVRLRFRINDGTLTLTYVLDRPEDVIRAAFADIVERVGEATSLEVFNAREPERA
jgi:uncharacterized protein YfdQ (DUF2303 family)